MEGYCRDGQKTSGTRQEPRASRYAFRDMIANAGARALRHPL